MDAMVTLVAALAISASPVKLQTTVVAGKKTVIVEVRLDDPRVRVEIGLAQGFPGSDEAFPAMVKRMRPTASINGAYFDKYSLKPIGDIWQHGQLLSRGLMGTAIGITDSKQVMIRRVQRHRGQDWRPYQSVLACGPALVLDGEKNVDARGEGFGDYVINPAPRMGVGYTADQRLMLVHVRERVSFEQFADVMMALGCVGAMNLDAGASLGMFADGRFILTPSRKLTNVINVFVD